MSEIKREPSIHITESKLKELLYETIGDTQIHKINLETLANELLLRAKKHSLSNRKLLVSNERHAKQAEKITKASLDETMIMAKVIYMLRKSLRHRGIEISKPGSKDWPYIKNITKNAQMFQSAHLPGAEINEAFKVYIQNAIKEMGKVWSLSRIQGNHIKIMENYEASIQLKNNDQSEYTDRAYKEYNKQIIQNVGTILTHYDKEPKEYKYFMEVAKVCKLLKVKPEIYIIAQFEGLAWAGGIPEPKQLIGVTADKRLQKYLFANKISLNQKPELNAERAKALKSLRNLK